MDKPDIELLEPETPIDDWGDFNAVISQLEQQETKTELTEEASEDTASNVEDKSESVSLFLDGMFTLAEQATTALSGVDFQFDAQGKEKVITAALPVLSKRGDGLMAVFGDYIEEGALLLAVIGLILGARQTISRAKALGGEHGETESINTQTA